MSEQKHGLGRGLDALFGDENEAFDLNQIVSDVEGKKNIEYENISLLKPRSDQPRENFDEESLKDLTESIKQKGVLQPILVRPKSGFWEIVAGERRYRAACKAGLESVPVVKKELSDAEAFEIALIENMLRENLSPIEEAKGFERLINEYHYTHEELAKSVGKSRSYITNAVRLLDLPLYVQSMVNDKKISAGHARVLIGLPNAQDWAEKIISKDLSVRQTEDLISRAKERKKPKSRMVKNGKEQELELQLGRILGVETEIYFGDHGKGRIVLKFNNFGELEHVLNILER